MAAFETQPSAQMPSVLPQTLAGWTAAIATRGGLDERLVSVPCRARLGLADLQ